MDYNETGKDKTRFLPSQAGLVLTAVLGIAAYFLWTKYRAPITLVAVAIPYLPLVVLFACALLHDSLDGEHGRDPD